MSFVTGTANTEKKSKSRFLTFCRSSKLTCNYNTSHRLPRVPQSTNKKKPVSLRLSKAWQMGNVAYPTTMRQALKMRSDKGRQYLYDTRAANFFFMAL